MNKKKLIRMSALLLVCALLLASLASCASWDNFYNAFLNKEEKPERIIRIAVFEPLTGSDANAAEDEVEGIKLANSLFPVVKGARIELVWSDNKSDTETAKLTAAEIARDDTILMLIGSHGNMLTVAAADIFKEAGIPCVNATSTNPLISNTTGFVCAAPVDAFQARAAAEFAVNELGERALAAVYSSSDELSKIRAQEFARYCEQTYKISPVPVIAVNEGSDPYYIAKALETAETTTVYMPTATSVQETLAAKTEELGLDLKWIGGNAWRGFKTPDLYFTADYDPYVDLTPMSKTLRDAWQRKYGSASVPSEEAALGFDAYLLAITALENAEDPSSRESIAAALMAVEELEGSTGLISIGMNGSPIRSVQVYRTEEESNELVFTAFGKKAVPEDNAAETDGGN
ncbi:MAG: ABC transporter substrate-binding protein [Clostridia bacterium]|nr:ABC transporter substrate-binding protein [Clostridia bacterium]